jgi:hypothetical protein
VKRTGKSRKRSVESEALTGRDVGRLVGMALVLLCFLLIASVPQSVYRYWKRDGYVATEVEIVSPSGSQRSISVRLTITGEELSIRRSTLDERAHGARESVWWNPDARLSARFPLLDERIVSAHRHPTPASGEEVLAGLVGTLASGALGGYLMLRPEPGRNRKRS